MATRIDDESHDHKIVGLASLTNGQSYTRHAPCADQVKIKDRQWVARGKMCDYQRGCKNLSKLSMSSESRRFFKIKVMNIVIIQIPLLCNKEENLDMIYTIKIPVRPSKIFFPIARDITTARCYSLTS
jgi:hypothetical protein